jgi:prevent-host-death family protein
MTSVPVTTARSKLYQLVDQVATTHEPVEIIAKAGKTVLLSGDDWRSIQETLYLLSLPGMGKSIREGMKQPLSKASRRPSW